MKTITRNTLRFFMWLLFPLFIFSSELKYLKFTGHKHIKTNQLYEVSAVKQPAWYQFWKEKTPKIDIKLIPSVKESLYLFYQSEGFYHADIGYEEDNTSITFQIRENDPIIINSIESSSNYDIKHLITYKKGKLFNAQKFVQIKQNIKDLMLKSGYCNYDLDAKARIDIEKNIVFITYKLSTNPICKFGNIDISGLETIDEKVIKSQLKYSKDEDFSTKKIDQSYNTISGLEAFDSVRINLNHYNNIINTSIDVKEKVKTRKLQLGLGYETDLGPRATLHWEQRNFRGNAKKIAFYMKYSDKKKFFKNQLFVPSLIPIKKDKYLDFKNEFSYSQNQYDNFNEEKYADTIHFLEDFDWFKINFGVGFENIDIVKTENVCNVIDGNFFLIFPFFKGVIDTRDSRLNPKNGFYFSHYMEGGVKSLGSSTTYTKFVEEVRFIKTFNKLTLALKGKVGLIEEFEKRLPESKLFFAGGSFSNRAYGYHKLGASDTLCNYMGGKTMIDTTVEISHPLYQELEGALFFDSTMLAQESFAFNTDFQHSIGLGFRYLTPIGPVKIDFGVNIKDFSQNAIHFQIGQSF